MFYGIRVNSALAKLGVRPAAIAGTDRRMLHARAEAAGATPQEAALIIAAELPLVHRFNLSKEQVEAWVRQKKINPQVPQIRDALGGLALWDVLKPPR